MMRFVVTLGGLIACLVLVVLLRGIGGAASDRLLDPVEVSRVVSEMGSFNVTALGPNWAAENPRLYPDLAELARSTDTAECENYIAALEDAEEADDSGLAARAQQKFTKLDEIGSGYYWATVSIHETARQAQDALAALVAALAMPERLKCAEAASPGSAAFAYSPFEPSATPPHRGRVFAYRASAVRWDPTRDNDYWNEVYVWRSANVLVTVFTSFPTRNFSPHSVAGFLEAVARAVDGSEAQPKSRGRR